MKEGYKRGIRPSVSIHESQDRPMSSHIDVQRLTEEQTGSEILFIRLDPSVNEWQKTDIGSLRVDPLIINQTRKGQVRFLRLHFDRRSELRQKGNGKNKLKSLCFRELAIDDSGSSWQELRRIESDGKRRPGRPKWLCVTLTKPSYEDLPSLQDGM